MATYGLPTRPERLAAVPAPRCWTPLRRRPSTGSPGWRPGCSARRSPSSPSSPTTASSSRAPWGCPSPGPAGGARRSAISFCRQVAVSGEPLVVEDTRRHPLLRHNPAVRELGWIAYAGVPLVTRQGHGGGAQRGGRDAAALVGAGRGPAAGPRRLRRLRDRAADRDRRAAATPARPTGGPEPFHRSFEDTGIPMALAPPKDAGSG